MNFEEFCNENSSEGMANVKALFGESGLGAAHIDMCSSAIASGCVLLRIMSFVAANNIGFSLHASANVSLSDEVVERVLQLSNSFLQYNISVPGTGNSRNTSLNSSKKRKPNGDGDSDGDESGDERDAINFNDDENNIVSKSKATKKQGKKGSKIKDSSQKTLLSFTLPVFIPLVRTLLYSLESFLSLRRQNERLCILAYELAVNVLRTDRSSNFKAGQVDPPGAALLVSLHYAAVVLMRCIFRKYPSCRQSMVSKQASKQPNTFYYLSNSNLSWFSCWNFYHFSHKYIPQNTSGRTIFCSQFLVFQASRPLHCIVLTGILHNQSINQILHATSTYIILLDSNNIVIEPNPTEPNPLQCFYDFRRSHDFAAIRSVVGWRRGCSQRIDAY